MIVDDAPTMRALLARAVTRAGCEVAGEAATLEEARDVAAARTLDAVIVDGRLQPGGLAALEVLRCAAAQAALFVTASLDETSLVRSAVAAGAQGAIRRPILASDVRAALGTVGRRDGGA